MLRADIQSNMKSLVVLFAGNLSRHAFEPIGTDSALIRAIFAASRFPDAKRVLVFADACDSDRIRGISGSFDIIVSEAWTISSFFSRVSAESEGFDHVFFARGSSPFLDADFAGVLYEKHRRYAAEYTFADGYPAGLAPEILARGILPVLERLASGSEQPVTAASVFDTIKKDINSFDIETDIAPVDLRHLRLDFSCDSKRNCLLCKSFDGITAANYADMIGDRASALRTLPAYFSVQVAGRCPSACAFCPYPAFTLSGKGNSPGQACTERTDFMPAESFARIIEKISAFSEDAVVSLSLWGECAFNPDIARLVKLVLDRPSLSVLIETTGLGWDEGKLAEIAAACAAAQPRANGQNPVNWIVSLDAAGSAAYGALHGFADGGEADRSLREALSFTEKLMALFPKAVWPQMVRMKENEAELETFYRFWKEKNGQAIVQKHDHFCKSIDDRRVADLSPLARHPCWHIKRDMCILLDGIVPACREDLYATRNCGNALTDEFRSIWDKMGAIYERHASCDYEGMCGACDEYYTYNF